MQGVYKRRDIIEDYSKYESQAYAPLTRHGNFPDRNAENFLVKNKYLDTYNGEYKTNKMIKMNSLRSIISYYK